MTRGGCRLLGIELTGFTESREQVLIDIDGEVKDVSLVRGVREDVDQRAIAAIRHWDSSRQGSGTRRPKECSCLSS